MNKQNISKSVQERDNQDICGDIEDGYVRDKINMFFGITGRFDPALEKKVVAALDEVINNIYEDGFTDGVDDERKNDEDV